MAYLFKGSLRGALCRDCIEPLAGLTLRLYTLGDDRNATQLAVANAKDTFATVDPAAVAAKAGQLLAEGVIDEAGNFAIEIPDSAGYQGQAFEVDLYCGTVPHLKPGPRPPAPQQFSITVLQPLWRNVGDTRVAAWEYTIPYRYWCGVRGRFGAWTICGQVRVCDTGTPVGGVRVRAFDVDWLQDDALGDALTDATGHFRIDYTADDFKQTIFSPWINIEWTGGPDLYFRVETQAGAVLLAEPSSRGRAQDRENAGPCFCVDLCLKEAPPDTGPDPLPVFDALGGYLFASAVESAVPGSGLTVGDHRAFYATVRLNGTLPKTLNGAPMEYRFEFRPTDAAGNPAGAWTPLGPGQFSATVLGKVDRYAPAFPGDPNPVKSGYLLADPASPAAGPFNAAIVGGWVQVPQFSNVFGPDGYFVPNGNLINAVTPALSTSPSIDVTGVRAGDSVTSLGAPLASNRHIGLRLRVRQIGNPASETDAGTCFHVAIENTAYNGVAKQGSWAPVTVNGQLAVVSVDAFQLRAGGCAGITTGLDVLLTAAHANLGGVGLSMTGPGGPYSFTLPAPVPGQLFGAATNNFDINLLPDCAYIINLSADLLLTTGDSSPLPVTDQIAFCKK